MHKLHVMSPAAGHTTLEWNPVDSKSIEEIEAEFDALVAKGYLGFGGGTMLTKFDPTVKEITMSPVVVAG